MIGKGVFSLEFWLAFGQAWLHPFLWISFFFPFCQIVRDAIREKEVTGERIHSPVALLVKTFFWGWVLGLLFSLTTPFLNLNIQPDEAYLVWLFSLLIACFGFRFLCFAHVVGLISLIHLIAQQIDHLSDWLSSHPLGAQLLQFSIVDWLWMVALFHIGEWLLIRLNGLDGRQIISVLHPSGYQVNGYRLNRIWPVPTLLFTPAGWLPIPLIVGFASVNLSKPIQQQKRLASTYALLHAAWLALCLSLVSITSLSLWIAALWALIGHELLFQYQRWKEKRLQPIFTSNQLGLKVLEVVPDSPAAQMGIRPGFILQQANEVSIRTIQDLEKVTQQSAHCKLKLLDGQRDHHFVQKVIYEDDPKHLGIIGAVSVNEVAAAKEEEHSTDKQSH